MIEKKQSGFTIVELLIVIVIIGILAALVIVAYTGIQNRARLTKNQTDAQAIQKKAEAYAADDSLGNGAYPTAAGNFTGSAALGGISVNFTTTAPTTNVAANGQGGSAYQVMVCNTNKGLRIYYYDPTKDSNSANIKSVVAGECS